MGKIKKFELFHNINENQSKKIRKYVDFSTFLDWFNKNRPVIAKILECDVDEIVDEETILKQSAGLIQHVINPQSDGNRGRDGVVELSGFKEFKKLKSKIIHDILHNIYDVTAKDFSRTNDYDYDESEYVEEIEVLALEETFMKYFNLEYVKSDFLNGNINRLAAFMMMVIIKNDPDRIVSILDGDVEPYIEVYGKKYPVEDTPFQNFYKMLKMIPINPIESDTDLIENGEDFEEWIANMCAVGDAIDVEGGDRANYPSPYYLGDKDMEDVDDSEFESFLDDSGLYYVGEDDLEGYGGETVNGYVISDMELPKDMDDVLGTGNYEEMSFEDLPKSIKEDDRFLQIYDEDTEPKTIYQITDNENIEHYGFFDRDEVDIIVHFEGDSYDNERFLIYKKEEIDEDEDDNDEEGSTEVQYELENELNGLYDEYDSDDIKDYSSVMEYWWEFYDEEIKSKTEDEHVNYSYYKGKSLESNVDYLFGEENSHSIARRYLRHNDTLVNNTEIGKGSHYKSDNNLSWDENQEKEKEHYNKKGYMPIGEESFDSSEYISLGKNLTTNNAKKLKQVFDTFRGWTIKNFADIKSKHKKLKNALSDEEMTAIGQMEEFFKKEKQYHDSKKDNYSKSQSDEYILYNNLTRDKDAYIFKFGEINKNGSVLKDLLKYADMYLVYKELFKKFEDEDILNYIKKIPSITNIDSIKNNLNRFEDMFKSNEVETLIKNRAFIERLITLSENLSYKDIFKKAYNYDSYLSRWEDLKIKREVDIINTMTEGVKELYNEVIKINPNFETSKVDTADSEGNEINYIQRVESDEWIDMGMDKLKFKIKK